MLNDADNFADIFRGGLPYYLLITLPILIFCSPCLASEFQVMSMIKFDVNGEHFGSRSSAISLEAKSLYTWNTGRHCVLARLLDISVSDLNEIRQKAGGLIVMLPKDVQALADDVKDHVLMLEQQMLQQSIPVPVYFAHFNKELEHIINDITYTAIDNDTKNKTAASQLLLSVSANGYHVTVDGQNSAANKNSKVPVIQGEFLPNQLPLKHMENTVEGSLPLILITASLKTFGIINDYPLNADAAVLMSLIEVFSKLHSMISTAPKYRIGFLLSDSGMLLNFQGSKKWLEMDDNMSLQNVEFVLCLDTITQSLTNNQPNVLYLHVSKPPKEKTSISQFFKLLKSVAGHHAENITVEGVHKKINLADLKLSWEHERFSMKRYPAFTLSSVKAPGSPFRTTMFRDNEAHIVQQTITAVKIIAETLACYMYKIDTLSEVFSGDAVISEANILPYLGVKSILQNNDIKDGFEKYLKNVKIIYDKPDAREPDFMFYNGIDAKLNVYRVKPAIFDLFLTIAISLYLSTVYLAIQFFPNFYGVVSTNSNDSIGNFFRNSQNALKRK
ncbi:nicalin-1 [Drosophila grimshawi]|uniref:GH13015 n=1 Tax=Drosophila grimshawi TaxID=7222 RepID=B4JP28_DROGR|nr:nicalin-1 [Drosophila grimshawi]EDV99453.1 GH13015 [Drosophila grimshawi]